MNFQSLSANLRVSCYNCRHFRVSADLMNGTCGQDGTSRSTIGIGTCDSFSKHEAEGFVWYRLLSQQRMLEPGG